MEIFFIFPLFGLMYIKQGAVINVFLFYVQYILKIVFGLIDMLLCWNMKR